MNVTIDLAKKHLQDMPENSDVLKADLIKIIAAYEALEQQLKNCNLQNVSGSAFTKEDMRLIYDAGFEAGEESAEDRLTDWNGQLFGTSKSFDDYMAEYYR